MKEKKVFKKEVLKKDHTHKGVKYLKGDDISEIKGLTTIHIAFMKANDLI
jgi:hypothetical protein